MRNDGDNKTTTMRPTTTASATATAAAAAAAVAAQAAAAAATAAAPQPVALLDVYTAGQSDTAGLTYTCFRIPSLLRTKAGAIIAFAVRGGRQEAWDVVNAVQTISINNDGIRFFFINFSL